MKRQLEITVSTKRSLLEVRKTLRPNRYRVPIDPVAFSKFMEPCDYKGWLQAGDHLGICLTGWLTIYLFSGGMVLASVFSINSPNSWFFFRGLAAYELGHGSVFKTKTLNTIFLRIYSIISWHNFHESAVSPTYHH